MADGMTRMPSGLMAKSGGDDKSGSGSPASYSTISTNDGNPSSSLPLILAVIALLLSGAALYFSLSGSGKGLDAKDRESLRGIAEDLRAIQNKEITLSSPLRTTVFIDKTFPITDILPAEFNIPISFSVPINTQVTAQSNTGQLVPLKIQDVLQVRTSVPIDTAKAYRNVTVSLQKEIPIETRFSATMRVSAVYGKELNDVITKLESISEEN